MRVLERRPEPMKKRHMHHGRTRLKTKLCKSCREGKHHCHSLWCQCPQC